MKKMPVSLLCGAAAILITIILYFTILGNVFAEAMCAITLLGVIFAEVLTTAFAYRSNGSPRKVAAAFVSGFGVPYALILSYVYIANYPLGYAAYAGLYFVGIIIIGVIAVILSSFDAKKSAENANFQDAKGNMLNLRKLVKCIMCDPQAEPYKQALNSIEEKLHFSNDNVIAIQDEQIRNMLIQLQQNISQPGFDSMALINEINRTIDMRNVLTSRNV